MKEVSNWLENARLAVVGLGYVGLPLAVEFEKSFPVLGYDINVGRISDLLAGIDITREVSELELADAPSLTFTSDAAALSDCNVYIITVPTPITLHKQPDLGPLLSASTTIGDVLKRGDTVVYESTVFPGCTEEICLPILEARSGLRVNEDFHVGYSPERVNPGDNAHKLRDIKKIVSGSCPETTQKLAMLYGSIITAGIYQAESIQIAEAAKVIENTQRDLNIALINELAMICRKLNIDTHAVLSAAKTKWNFLPFEPGLVGGHCIGVDPYYLTYKAEQLGYYPQVILAGRRINDGMGTYVAAELVKAMIKRRIEIDGSRILIMGIAFKENCPDIRNTRIVDIIHELRSYGVTVDAYDDWVRPADAKKEYNIDLVGDPPDDTYDGVVLAVAHRSIKELGATGIRNLGKENHVLYDLKNILAAADSDLRL